MADVGCEQPHDGVVDAACERRVVRPASEHV
jgi:hypothetical protein